MALPVDFVTGLQNSTYSPPKSTSQDLSSIDFMKLIIAQMRNQNPLDPQKDSDFMAQMAQFESLNQMRAVASGIKVMQGVTELTSAAAMLGRTVTGKQVDAVAYARDIVARDLFGTPFAQLSSPQRLQVNSDERVQQAAADLPNAGREVTGRVDRVLVGADGIPMLFVGDRVLDPFTVVDVH
ncbi:MAG: hypothetical protein IT304_07775 [Dehalococcoidia bacterium]|nr:hypothetical protein [Dehalococcoidia bacterium]